MIETYEIKWAKTNPNAIIPSKEHGDAGYDIYACIDHDYTIAPNTCRLIDTGIAYEITPSWHLIAMERGSTAKINLKRSAGCNDNGFRGSVQAFLYNGNADKTIILSKDEEATKQRLIKNYEKHLREKFGNEYRGFNQQKLLEKYIIYPVSKAIIQLVPLYSPDGISETVEYDQISQTSRGRNMLGSSQK